MNVPRLGVEFEAAAASLYNTTARALWELHLQLRPQLKTMPDPRLTE